MTPEIVSAFRKSSYSDQLGNCVELARTADGGRVVRDSKSLDEGVQFHSARPWASFMTALKDSAFPTR
ncbi:DUF397 domain-containing protein [Streptomyces sp. NPDC091292]|uniref:DUF397 domain-containing protein n=1 Tax=Streptomyces sp. NPDC091292 TaxID=3365991 RepID=UPI00382387DC